MQKWGGQKILSAYHIKILKANILKKNCSGIFLIICLIVLTYSVLEGNASTSSTWIVDASGGGNFASIQEALDQATSGDAVYVKSGVYFEHLEVSKSVSLVGESRETTIIDGGGEDPGSVVIVSANDVIINGFKIQNSRSGGNAIWVENCNRSIISDNIICDNGDGIRILRSANNIVINNLITGNPYTGLGFNWAYDNIVQNNTIANNKIGIGGGYEPCYNNIFVENTIANNSKGIEVDFSISKFYHNKIINNSIQVNVYTSNFSISWDNGFPSGGNYWSDYTGIDDNNDGIGDTPYVINALNKDNYPFILPSLTTDTPEASPSAIPTTTPSPSPAVKPTSTPSPSTPASSFLGVDYLVWYALIGVLVALAIIGGFVINKRTQQKKNGYHEKQPETTRQTKKT